MPFAHFDSLFVFAAVGLSLLLVGGLNLALGGRCFWLRASVTLVLCGAVLGGLMALARPELTFRAARILLGVLLVATVLGSESCARRLTALAAFFRKPAPRWGLVALGGLGLILGSGLAFDLTDEEIIEQQLQDLDVAVAPPPSHPTDRARAATDRGTPIILREPISLRTADELAGQEEKTLRRLTYSDQVIRHSQPEESTNCHGWVFTGGKFILAPDDVETILKDNGYREVHEPQPGDLVIYRNSGGIVHSAVVRYVTEGQPVLIEGKWGALGVFLHPADKSCYGTEYTFHRSARTGHLLVGLGGSPAQHADQPGTAE
jgi:hypothetical protein